MAKSYFDVLEQIFKQNYLFLAEFRKVSRGVSQILKVIYYSDNTILYRHYIKID